MASSSKSILPMPPWNDAILVGAVTHLTSLGIVDCSFHIGRHSAGLGVWHQATRAQYLAQLTYNAHGVG